MYEQLNLFDYSEQKPPVGSTVYFITANIVKSAIVISHDATFAGLPYTGYIKVKEPSGVVWRVKRYYTTKTEAKKHI